MAIDSVSYILAESESFWEFVASLLQLTVEDLNTVELFDFAEIIKEFFKDPQVVSFFGSISKATRKTTAV
jgi:hypothetical protein